MGRQSAKVPTGRATYLGGYMNAETQAALTAAKAAIDTARATWDLFDATIGLGIITALAVIVGGLAARSANETYRLEAEPVLVITQAETAHVDPRLVVNGPISVVTGAPSLAEGLLLRDYQQSDEPLLPASASVPKPIFLEVQNVGRSPALDIQLDFDLMRGALVKPGHEYVGFEPEHAAKDAIHTPEFAGLRSGIQRGGGRVRIPAIAAQSKVYVQIESLIGISVRLTPRSKGTQLDISRQRNRRSITVVTPASSFILEGAS